LVSSAVPQKGLAWISEVKNSCHILIVCIVVVAFVKGDYPNRFPGLEVRYMRGSDPFIKLMNDQREVMETLSIDKWDTDTIVEFLSERLEK